MFYFEKLTDGRIIPGSFIMLCRMYKISARKGLRPVRVFATDDPIYLGM